MKPQRYLDEQRLPKFNFFRAIYEELAKLVDSVDWENELRNYNVETATKRFYDLLKTLLVHVPKVEASFSHYPCWYSFKLIRLIAKKAVAHQLLNDLKKRGRDTTEAYETFSKLQRSLKNLQDECHDNYTKNTEEKLSSNTKCFFSYSKALKASNSLPNVVQHDGV